MTQKEFVTYFKRAILILIGCLLLFGIARISFACTLMNENENEVETPAESKTQQELASEIESNNESSVTTEKSTEAETNNSETNISIVLAPTTDAGQEYINDIVFLGDSTTYALSHYGLINKNQIWTGAGENGGTIGTLSLYSNINKTKIYYPDNDSSLTIEEAAATKKPKYLVITLGLNGGVSDYFSESQFKVSYRKIIQAVQNASPETVIIIQNIFPVASNIDNEKYTKITNENIQVANEWLKDIAKEYNLKYLDSRECLIDSDGNMKIEYQSGDGIHMTPAALQVLLNYIRTHAYHLQTNN